jgi:DnaJ-domain-containing protein 1
MKDGREVVLTSESQPSPRENLKLIQLCVDDMRMIERRGMDSLMRSAYLQLEAPEVERDPYEVLSVRPGSPREVVEASYRALAKMAHPDAGGSAEEMAALNAALEQIKQREGW